jgi:type II secretory pathway pseudopilin PulG
VSTPGARDRRVGCQAGFTYVAVLMLLAALSAGLAGIGTLWHTQARREREEELLFIGEQFRAALRSYVQRSPAGARRFPNTLEELLEDRRQPIPVRHLRRIFVDPMTRRAEWGLLRQPDGGIRGVHSLSTGRPFRTDDLPGGLTAVATYAEWKFAVDDAAPVPAGGGAVAGAVPGSQAAGQPAAPAVPAAPVAATAPAVVSNPQPEAPPAVERRTERCEVQRGEDLRACAAPLEAGASIAEVGQCTASASARFFACLRGQTPLPLRLPGKAAK